jgi:hypothetical protein
LLSLSVATLGPVDIARFDTAAWRCLHQPTRSPILGEDAAAATGVMCQSSRFTIGMLEMTGLAGVRIRVEPEAVVDVGERVVFVGEGGEGDGEVVDVDVEVGVALSGLSWWPAYSWAMA